jgi:hypothetical protein
MVLMENAAVHLESAAVHTESAAVHFANVLVHTENAAGRAFSLRLNLELLNVRFSMTFFKKSLDTFVEYIS